MRQASDATEKHLESFGKKTASQIIVDDKTVTVLPLGGSLEPALCI